MARKITNHWPILQIALLPTRGSFDSATAGYELMAARDTLKPIVGKLLGPDVKVEFDWRIDEDAVCEFCGYKWTEDSPTYNGGCCDADEANAPAQAAA